MIKTKSFRFDPVKHPWVEQWLSRLQESNIDFSKAIRELIKENQTQNSNISDEIAEIKRQIEMMRTPVSDSEPIIIDNMIAGVDDSSKKETALSSNCIKDRYFS